MMPSSMKFKSRPLLQVALDVLCTQQAMEIASEVYPYVDIFEIGTPLIIAEGLKCTRNDQVRISG